MLDVSSLGLLSDRIWRFWQDLSLGTVEELCQQCVSYGAVSSLREAVSKLADVSALPRATLLYACKGQQFYTEIWLQFSESSRNVPNLLAVFDDGNSSRLRFRCCFRNLLGMSSRIFWEFRTVAIFHFVLRLSYNDKSFLVYTNTDIILVKLFMMATFRD